MPVDLTFFNKPLFSQHSFFHFSYFKVCMYLISRNTSAWMIKTNHTKILSFYLAVYTLVSACSLDREPEYSKRKRWCVLRRYGR